MQGGAISSDRLLLFESFCVALQHDDTNAEPSVGVLVQGINEPLVLSALHNFVNDSVHVGKIFHAFLQAPSKEVDVEVFFTNAISDLIIFKVLTKVQRMTPKVDTHLDGFSAGQACVLFGYSTPCCVDNNGVWCLKWRMIPGIISSGMLNTCTVAFSGGCVPGDSGGPVFNVNTGALVGLLISADVKHPAWSDLQPARAQSSPEGLIRPFWVMRYTVGGEFLTAGGTLTSYGQDSTMLSTYIPVYPHLTLCTTNDSSDCEDSGLIST